MHTSSWFPRAVAAALLLPLPAGRSLEAQDSAAVTRICLAPASVEAAGGSATSAIDAVRETFTSYLTGPSLQAQPLTARLAAQVREEAKQAGCPFLLLTTIEHVQKRSGGGLLGRMAAGAAQQGAWEAGVASGSAAGRIVGQAAYGAAGQAAHNYAYTIRNKDELTLDYRLESGAGTVLLEKREKRKAKQDGEDLLSLLVQQAAERILEAARRAPQ